MVKPFLVAVGLSMAGAGHLDAQANGAQRSTSSGVYTNDQANRGRDVYAMQCRSCHTPASHTGAVFAAWWDRKTLADLFQFIVTRMPKNEPGSLQADEYLDVTAYLLKLNELPTGNEPLPADTVAMKKIQIDVGKKAP